MSTKRKIIERICTVPRDFGMSVKRRSSWSPEEESTLFKLLKTDTTMEIVYKTFPNKTKERVVSKIYKMGFKTRGR